MKINKDIIIEESNMSLGDVVNNIQKLNNDMYSNDVYSTNEFKTNKKWINGKPIYNKVMVFNQLPNNTAFYTEHKITNIDEMISLKGFCTNGGNFLPLPYTTEDATGQIKLSMNITHLYITTSNDKRTYKGFVIFEYTKTTD